MSEHSFYRIIGTSSMEDQVQIRYFFQMFSFILTHAFFFQYVICLGITVSSFNFSIQIQMMVNDDKTYFHSKLIAVAFYKYCSNAFKSCLGSIQLYFNDK